MRSFFTIFAAVLAFVQIAAATPPACLLAALGVQGNPTDMKAVCGDLQESIRGNLTDACNTNMLPKAYEAYSSKCKAEGLTVADLSTSTSSAHSSTKTASSTSTGVVSVSASATPTESATGTSDNSESSGNSGNSGSSSTSATDSSTSAIPTDSAGMATKPQSFLFAAAALLATGLTSVVFL